MNTAATAVATGSPLSRYYFIVWLALGAAGIFYITIASLAPEALHSADAGVGFDATNIKVAALSSTVSELKTRADSTDGKVQSLGGGIDSLKSDMSGLKVKFSDLASLDQTMATRLSALEGQPVPSPAPGAKASSLGGSAPAATLSVASKAAGPAVPKIEGVVMPDDTQNEAAIPADPTEPIPSDPTIQARKASKVASAGTDAKAASAPKPYALDLAMSTSSDALKQIWQLFKEQHPELLAGLTPRYVTAGPNVRLLAGPFPSQAAAASQCARMRKEGLTCTPAPMAGTPL